MKYLFLTLLFTQSVFAATSVFCYEQKRGSEDLELTTIVTKNVLLWKYKRLADGEVYEKGILRKDKEGSGDEYSLCLGKMGDMDWFSFCVNDEITMRRSPHGNLVSMYGIREYDLGIELLCEEKILNLL